MTNEEHAEAIANLAREYGYSDGTEPADLRAAALKLVHEAKREALLEAARVCRDLAAEINRGANAASWEVGHTLDFVESGAIRAAQRIEARAKELAT